MSKSPHSSSPSSPHSARRAARLWRLLAVCTFLHGTAALAQVRAASEEAGIRQWLPSASVSGRQRFTQWGFDIYDATLWVEPGFHRNAFAQHGFALELAYLRSFNGEDIASRSLAEMNRAGEIRMEQARAWRSALQAMLPNVQRGDRILGVHLPRRGAQFFLNGRRLGEINDPAFSERFFGIWLAPATSQPALRDALLIGTPP